MDSITKLRAKLSEAESLLQYVSKELEGYSDTGAEEHLNFAELKLRGEQYAFYEHPLTGKLFRDDYLALLIYLISLGGKKEEGWTVLYRIAAACDYQGELQNLTTDAMTFTEERLSDLIREIYTAELANIFAIDSLMISHHMGADDAQLKFLAGVYELLKLDKGFLTEAMEFVKTFDSTFWSNFAETIGAWKSLTINDILIYIAYPVASFKEAMKLKYNRIVVSNITYTDKSVLKLDDWKPNEILFLNCRFENCGGISSNNKVVKFVGCTFDGNIARWISSDYGFRFHWSDKQYSAYRGFLHFNNAEFLACSFNKFNDAVPMMYLNGGSIRSCNFENCSQAWSACMLIYVNNVQITGSKFTDCFNGLDSNAPNQLCQSCVFYSSNSTWKKCDFSKCCSNPTILHNDLAFNCLLLLDKNSYCTGCSFKVNQVTSTNDVSGYRRIPAHVIGLHNSKQSDNVADVSEGKFTKVGEIKNISKDIFIIGDKHYDD